MLSVKEIENVLKKHKHELKTKFGVKEIGVFGSYVRGEQRGDSDIDILVEFEPVSKISLLDFVSLENHLGDLLNVKVDLVEKSVLKPRIGRNILKEVVYV